MNDRFDNKAETRPRKKHGLKGSRSRDESREAMHLRHSQDPVSKNRLRLWLRLLSTMRVVEAELRDKLRAEFDTTMPRFDVMGTLYRYQGQYKGQSGGKDTEGLFMGDISRLMKVSNGNVTGIVDRLEKDGLVRRHTLDGDRRASIVQLTESGYNEFQRQSQKHEEWVDLLLHSVDAAQAIGFCDILAEIEHKIEEER